MKQDKTGGKEWFDPIFPHLGTYLASTLQRLRYQFYIWRGGGRNASKVPTSVLRRVTTTAYLVRLLNGSGGIAH